MGAVTEKEAQYELAAMEASKTAPRATPQATTAKKAVDESLRPLTVSGRRQGTVDHAADMMQPLLAEWSDRPMAKWTRARLEALLDERGQSRFSRGGTK